MQGKPGGAPEILYGSVVDYYAAALVAITADTDEERAFLDRLGAALELNQDTRRDLHARLGLDA